MSLLAAYTFNESDCHDYSGNKYHLTNSGVTYSPTTATNGGFGYDAMFGASGHPALSTSSFRDVSAYTGLTVIFNIYTTTLASVQNVLNLAGPCMGITIDTAGKINFSTFDGTSTGFTVISNTALSINTWYTVACVYDGTNNYVYINGVLDNTATGADGLHTCSGSLTIGGSSKLSGNLNMMEISTRAYSAADVAASVVTPGGVLVTTDTHNFATGDLIADASVNSQAVVSWVVDGGSYYIYPFTTIGLTDMFRVGNIYNTLRQSYFQINNDFDGNGNARISIKQPIASFADYASPASTMTWDYTGFNGITGPTRASTKTMISYRL